jgi:2,4-dienoyl-CoA reductase-like NADH-dependent reductase (Old Yellow Enzyme family)
VVADFVSAARRAEQAGFSGIEIHGANGYLFTQFLAPEDNTRSDEYGGRLENRARFLRETVRAVRAAVASSFAVGVRISPVDLWDRRGLVLDDGAQLAVWLASDGADFIHLSLRGASDEPPHEPGRGPVARAVREAVPSEVPILAAGGIWTRDDAARAYDAGADMVALGRSAIAHPDWPRVAGSPEWAPHKPPWDPARLREAGVGAAFLDYLSGFAGMVVGGRGARG